jgi:lipopolysaccharide transport system permease protein
MNDRKPTYVVEADKMLSSDPKELWAYRELFMLLVKRDFIASYKQTVLGPLWFFVQPFLATLVYIVMFSQIARLPTSNLPPLIFYMSGIIVWSYFSNCMTQVSFTFVSNGGIFRKIYFPRIIAPLSQISMNFLNFLAQIIVLFAVVAVYEIAGNKIQLTANIVFIPLILIEMAMLALGLGCLIAAATVKYRDLTIIVGYTLQLWMFVSFVIYPRSAVPEKIQSFLMFNPMASMVETYRACIFGTERAELQPAVIAACITVVVLVAGLWAFRHAEGTFTDSI